MFTMPYNRTNSPLYQLLLDSGRSLKLPKGQVVSAYEESAPLNLIKSGYIKRYLITKDGSSSIQVIFGPGDLFPLTPVYKATYEMDIYSGPEQYYYESMTDIEIFSIKQSDLQAAISENPLIYKDLFYAAGLRLNSYIHRLESMSLRAANKKVAHQLVYLADIFGKPNESGVSIQVPLTHQNLADMLNLARETVSHIITRLQEKGLIEPAKNIIILDIDRLRREAR
jgi:CRP-like cAMP-binding protein